MPILVKDYKWDNSEKNVFITVPLKGVKPHKVNILSTDDYVKVSYPPYIFECFLFSSVHDQKASVEIGNGIVLFKFEKQQPALWPDLENPNKADKTWQRERREEVLKKIEDRAEEKKKTKQEVKRELDRYGVKEQMKLEEDDHKRIENLKETERTQATEELEKWKEQQEMLAQQEKEKKEQQQLKEEIEKKELAQLNKKNKKELIFEQESPNLPVRQSGKIEISFTEREFPTPLRESVKPEEDEWLKKQVEVRRIADIQDKDLSEEERNPQWLKDKGDSFFKAGNFLAAINAYTHAIRLNSRMHSLFSNRAACHLKLGNMFKCAEDCSKALDLLTPPVPQNATSRMKAHIRRGTAYCHLQAYVEGLMDYEAALKIDPNNEQLKEDAEKARQIIQSSTGS